MFKVNINNASLQTYEGKLKDFIGNNYTVSHSAFIGQCGVGPRDSLYLIVGNCICLANDPSAVWFSEDCSVSIRRWVDIEIRLDDSKY